MMPFPQTKDRHVCLLEEVINIKSICDNDAVEKKYVQKKINGTEIIGESSVSAARYTYIHIYPKCSQKRSTW